QNERRLRRVALRCLVPRRGIFRRVAVRARGARAICFLCAVGPYVPACAVLRYGRALAVSERGSPTLVQNHWQPNRNARRRIVFLLEQIVVRGKDALVGLPLLLFPIPIEIVTPRRRPKRGHHLAADVFRVHRPPNHGGNNMTKRGGYNPAPLSL